MQIDELLALVKQHINAQQDKPILSISNDWAQGRTGYGGVSEALIYAAIKEKVSTDQVLRSFTCNFVGPLNTGEPFDISV
ncbi:MAG: acyl-CoA thioesterase [Paraglaciecola sp.]|jgi:acyl-CoA thioesterase